MLMIVTVIWRSLQGTLITYLQRNLKFDMTQLIATYSYTVWKRAASFDLYSTGSWKFWLIGDYNYGNGNAANVHNDEIGYLLHAMETRQSLEMNHNQGRLLVTAETDSESGPLSKPLNTRPKEPCSLANRTSWVRRLIPSAYPGIQRGIACEWWRARRRRSCGTWG